MLKTAQTGVPIIENKSSIVIIFIVSTSLVCFHRFVPGTFIVAMRNDERVDGSTGVSDILSIVHPEIAVIPRIDP